MYVLDLTWRMVTPIVSGGNEGNYSFWVSRTAHSG